MTKITRPALRYHGGKWRIAPWIIESFPPHYTYVEPFGGAASVLLRKPPSPIEVYNDIDNSVVTFFRVLREREDELIRAIDLTPWSRAETELSSQPADGELELARRFFVWCWQSFGHRSGGWRYQHSPGGYFLTEQWDSTEYLHAVARRMKNVTIERGDAIDVIRRFDRPHSLIYADPPYVHDTRAKTDGYVHEMDESEHRELAAVLNGAQGMVVLSGYDSDLYQELYPGWECREKRTATNGGDSRVEVLWLSPNAVAAMPPMDLWSLTGGGESLLG